MIDIDLTTTCYVGSLPLGSIFIPGVPNQQKFIAGLVSSFPVVVCLSGETPFRFADPDKWNRGPGAAVEGIRLEVDPESAMLGDEDAPLGSIVRMGSETALLASESGTRTVPVNLRSSEQPRDIKRGDVAFTRWRIVVGEGQSRTVLFEADVGLV